MKSIHITLTAEMTPEMEEFINKCEASQNEEEIRCRQCKKLISNLSLMGEINTCKPKNKLIENPDKILPFGCSLFDNIKIPF